MSEGDRELDEIRYHWGEAYLIGHLGPDVWVAQRRDSHETLGADSPAGLTDRIRADYQARPVSRRTGPIGGARSGRGLFLPEG